MIIQEIKKSLAELKAELIDRYEEWYNKAKMVVAFCELNRLKKRIRKEQEEKARREELDRSQESERRLSSTAERG